MVGCVRVWLHSPHNRNNTLASTRLETHSTNRRAGRNQMSTTTQPVIRDCLGNERQAVLYQDGSWNCPFCNYAVMIGRPEHTAQKCANPRCFARGGAGMPEFPVATAHEILAKQAQRAKEEQDRLAIVEWNRSYAAERAATEQARVAEIASTATAKSACLQCALESAKYGRTPKYTKHRNACPKSK